MFPEFMYVGKDRWNIDYFWRQVVSTDRIAIDSSDGKTLTSRPDLLVVIDRSKPPARQIVVAVQGRRLRLACPGRNYTQGGRIQFRC